MIPQSISPQFDEAKCAGFVVNAGSQRQALTAAYYDYCMVTRSPYIEIRRTRTYSHVKVDLLPAAGDTLGLNELSLDIIDRDIYFQHNDRSPRSTTYLSPLWVEYGRLDHCDADAIVQGLVGFLNCGADIYTPEPPSNVVSLDIERRKRRKDGAA